MQSKKGCCSDKPISAGGMRRGLPWAWWAGVTLAEALILLWMWLLVRPRKEKPVRVPAERRNGEIKLPEEGVPLERMPVMVSVKTPGAEITVRPESSLVAPDDLKEIEGIGPKIAQVLSQAGINSFSRLAAADPQEITRILKEAGIRLAFPATWPEQARLAAIGAWEQLRTLQEQLKAGRTN